MPNTVPITQGVLALDGHGRAILSGWPASRYEDATGGDPEGTAGNIISPQTIDGATPTKLKTPKGAMRLFVRTNAANGLRVGNNADLTAGTLPLQPNQVPGGYVVAQFMEWQEVGVQAESSGAAPTGTESSLSTSTTAAQGGGNVNNTTGNPEVYVMLNDADDGEAEIFFYYGMLY